MKPNILESKNNISLTEISRLTEKVGWGDAYYKTEAQWQRVLFMSAHIAYMKVNGEVIGFARVVEDGQMCMFYDVCVCPEYQRQGIGSALMNHLIDKIKDNNYISVGLFVWDGNKTASEFYSQLGFEKVVAMELKKHIQKI